MAWFWAERREKAHHRIKSKVRFNAMQQHHFVSTPGAPRASTQRRVEPRREPKTPELSAEEEAVLSGIATSGQFTLKNVSKMYAGMRRLRDQK
jgi:hypothetical protein